MRLKSVTITNFRSYRSPTTIPIDSNITGITGRNDAGKSSILEALDIFFEGGEIALDKDDFNISSKDSPVEIICTFDSLPQSIIIDESCQTSLKDEFLLDNDGCLQIRKVYKPTALTKPQIFLIANHPTDKDYGDLHTLKLAELRKRAQVLEIDPTSISDQRKSSSWRRAIWSHSKNLKLSLTALDVAKELTESKDLYASIHKNLPMFALFRSDRESRDNDPHAKNPLQEAVKQAQAELKDEIEALQKKIQDKVIERAEFTIEKLREMAPQLAEKLFPRFKSPPKWTFDFSLDGDDDIPINKRGSGVRRLILLNFFRAEAERKVATTHAPSVIYAIEEPETSQHPSNQELLIRALLTLANKDTCQILVTTHVPALAGLLPVNGLRFIEQVPTGAVVSHGSEDVLDRISDSLGVLPDKRITGAKGLLLVEGPGDVTFINHAAQVLSEAKHIDSTLEARGISVIWIGGCGNLKHWVNKRIAESFGIPWAILLDSDLGTTEEDKNKKAIENHVPSTSLFFLTRKREPENYIHPDVVVPFVCPGQSLSTYSPTCDAKNIIADATGTRSADVIDKFWTKMNVDQVRQMEIYLDDSGTKRYEITEILNASLGMVKG